jgi:uncharacterized protein
MRRLALIIFAREPVSGKTKTRLAQAIGPEKAAVLADAFNRDAIAKAKRLAPSELVIAGTSPGGAKRSAYFRTLARQHGAWLMDQGSGDLGARMYRVLRTFTTSASGAAIIGTDTPSLPVRLLARGVDLLERCPLVLCPTLDGGYYLIGVRGKIPDAPFRRMKWGGSRVFAETIARLRSAHEEYAIGPWWYDVDRAEDLEFLKHHLSNRVKAFGGQSMPLGSPHPCRITAAAIKQLGI